MYDKNYTRRIIYNRKTRKIVRMQVDLFRFFTDFEWNWFRVVASYNMIAGMMLEWNSKEVETRYKVPERNLSCPVGDKIL